MQKEKSIFRQVSLERLSSPEQLDLVLRVTDPRTWIGLGAIFLLLVTAVIWGFKGSITTTSQGQGVIVRSGGVLNVVSVGSGVVLELKVRNGDRIKPNEVVARIAQPVMMERVRSLREALAQAIQEREHTLQRRLNSSKLQLEALQRQRSNTEVQIEELNEQARITTEEAAADEQLAGKGLITKQQALATRQKLIGINDQIANLKAQIKQIDAQQFTTESAPQEDDTQMRDRIASSQRELTGVEKELSLAENVVSSYGGQVLELKTSPGTTVGAGEPILSIQPDVQNLELIAYLPSAQAKDTKIGMEVQISPATIKREEYGFMEGEIEYVADYPATPAALMRNFANEILAKTLSATGAVTEVRAALKADTRTPSGYKWSTSWGPDLILSSGTICTVTVVTKRQRPIGLLFPYIKDKLGLK
jgi:HlyD family secretion protein